MDCASKRYLSHRPTGIIGNLCWKKSKSQVTMLVEVKESFRTVNVIECSEGNHSSINCHVMFSKISSISHEKPRWARTTDKNSRISRNIIKRNEPSCLLVHHVFHKGFLARE